MNKELIKKARKGDKQAFSLIFNEDYRKELYILAKSKLGNDEDAKDAVQDTVLEAYIKIEKLRNEEKFKYWIKKILINKCNDIYRKQDKHNLSFEDIAESNYSDKEEIYNSIENNIDIFSLIRDLNDKEKQIILLHIRGYENKEISKKLKINENTVRCNLMRIRRKIKSKNERMGLE